eukprot:6212376-Amphidinium_carterae.1
MHESICTSTGKWSVKSPAHSSAVCTTDSMSCAACQCPPCLVFVCRLFPRVLIRRASPSPPRRSVLHYVFFSFSSQEAVFDIVSQETGSILPHTGEERFLAQLYAQEAGDEEGEAKS